MAKKKIIEDQEVDIIEETTPEVTQETIPDELETLKSQMAEKDKLIADERAKADELTKEREALRREKDELSQKFTQESTEKVKFQNDSIDSRIAATKTESESLEKQMEDAIEKGDFKAYAKIHTQFTRNQLAIDRYTEQKANIEAVKSIPAKTPTQVWIENHPEFNTNPLYKAIAIKGDALAQKQGIRVESPEYFKVVEQLLEREFYEKEIEETEEVEEIEVPKARRMESAPPSRGHTSTSAPQKVSLTVAQVADALNFFAVAPNGKKRTSAEAKLAYWEARQEGLKSGQITQ